MRSNLRKKRGCLKNHFETPRVQFPPAGGTVCEADHTRTNKEKTRLAQKNKLAIQRSDCEFERRSDGAGER